MKKISLRARIQANYSSFDKALNPATRAEGMAEVFSTFPELIGVSISQNSFEFQSIKNPEFYITIRKQSTGWELSVMSIPEDDK